MPNLILRLPISTWHYSGYHISDGRYNYEFYTAWTGIMMPVDKRYFSEIFGEGYGTMVNLDMVFVGSPYSLAYVGKLCGNIVVKMVKTGYVTTALYGYHLPAYSLEVFDADTGKLCGIVLQSVITWPFDRVVYVSPCVPDANICYWYSGPYDKPFTIPTRIRPYEVKWFSLNMPPDTCCIEPEMGIKGNFWSISLNMTYPSVGGLLIRPGPDIFLTDQLPREILIGELF